ncbi:MAG: SDR family oxidoreductase [Balneolales bacterium]
MADQKCALITGASSGIGKELTYLLARDGYSLILTALNKRKLEGFGMQVNEVYKVPVETIQADLSQETGARKLFDEVRKRDLSVDVLINNAGVGLYGDFRDVDMDEYFQIININIISFTHIAKLFVHDIIEKKGKILNTASVASLQPGPHMSVYYASKAYDLSFSLALAEELEPHGVTVTALCPGPTETNFKIRARQEQTRAFQNKMLTMEAREVAKTGYEAMKKGKRMVTAGTKNKVTLLLERLMSQKAITKLSRLYLTETGRLSSDKKEAREKMASKTEAHLEQGMKHDEPLKKKGDSQPSESEAKRIEEAHKRERSELR